jgi:mediator of RNA polymerase II transcription subunit 7
VLEPVPFGYHNPSPPAGEVEEANKAGVGIVWPPPLNWEATLGWMENLVINLGWLVNEFRPIQARMALESMMQRQIDIRREETKIIHG